ncbi:MAG: ABC transporter permease subunit [Thermoguttaceae bacterium]
MVISAKTTLRRAKRTDAVARWVILLGGVTVIGSVVAILVLIVGVTLPLFRTAHFRQAARVALTDATKEGEVLAVGVDRRAGDGSLTAHLVTADGKCTFVDLRSGKTLAVQPLRSEPASGSPQVMFVEGSTGGRYSLAWSDGSLSAVEVRSGSVSAEQEQAEALRVRELASVSAEGDVPPAKALIRTSEQGSVTTVRLFSDGHIAAQRQVVTENLLGDREVQSRELAVDLGGLTAVTAVTMDREGTALYAGTDSGQLARWQFDDEGKVHVRDALTAFSDHRAVTSLAMMFGDVSLAVGDAKGELTTWFPVRRDGKSRLTRIHTLEAHSEPVRQLVPASRGRTLLSLAGDTIYLDHATSERHLLTIRPERHLGQVGLSAQGNVAVAVEDGSELVAWEIDAPHAEVSWRTLFGQVWYEGYDRPEYSWQTTGGDDFEPKLSLVPIVFGTLKGTFYSMLLAVPLALLSAIYTSYFTTPALKRVIKPAVEIMAAVPSVVLGFLVALWLAPLLERWILAVFIGLVTIPAAFLAFLVVWQAVRRFHWAKSMENGYEFLVLLPVLILGAGAAAFLTPWIETAFFQGDFRAWLYEVMTLRYDQRNCVVIAFGLGFAVIPIIFSIAEDALSTVPYSLTASSLALGASRWQTLWRVILPSASPGIFAAIMIGLGRAVGETMIVLMATGNTPILDWGPFNGMRTLSANIAVEIPEAPVGGTLYRVLFLCAVILFTMTFLLNTVAELVRQRLRKRFGRL